MLELPEIVTIARQMGESMVGDPIDQVAIERNRPRFLFLEPDLNAFTKRLLGRSLVEVSHAGKWILGRLDNGMILLVGEMFGRISYVPPGGPPPKKVHVAIGLRSGATLAITIQAWGSVQVLTDREIAEHPYARIHLPDPTDPGFTREHFTRVLEERHEWNRKPIKAFLVHEGNVPGIGNGMLQDILFRARLGPKHRASDITRPGRTRLYQATVDTIADAVRLGGRDTEKDLHGAAGKYVPQMDRRTAGRPCPECGTPIVKISYLGGPCYLCPVCQSESPGLA